jgi:CrcB protein
MAARDLHILAAIGVGGGIGSIVRYGIGQVDPSAGDDLPLATLAINVSGALLLGLLIGALAAAIETGRRPSRLLRPFLGTGILGGYTTFSTFAVQVNRLSSATAVTYILLSVTGGLVAAALGARAGATLLGRPSAALPPDPDLP